MLTLGMDWISAENPPSLYLKKKNKKIHNILHHDLKKSGTYRHERLNTYGDHLCTLILKPCRRIWNKRTPLGTYIICCQCHRDIDTLDEKIAIAQTALHKRIGRALNKRRICTKQIGFIYTACAHIWESKVESGFSERTGNQIADVFPRLPGKWTGKMFARSAFSLIACCGIYGGLGGSGTG